MKKHICSTLQAAAIAIASWLLPTQSWAAVEVNQIFYELDEATQTAVVVASPNKYVGYLGIPDDITVDGKTYVVTAIDDCALLDCHDLITFDISSTVTRIGFSAFERCYSLRGVWFGEGLKSISYEAFKDCTSLERAYLPETLKTIGDRSFLGCTNLNWINIPASVTYFGDQFLSGCPLLALLANSETPLSVKSNAFTGLDKENVLLMVPEGSKEAYQTAKVWKTFPNILEVIQTDLCGLHAIFYITPDLSITIKGTGRMYDFGMNSGGLSITDLPVEKLIVEDGITYLGDEAFSIESLSSIDIPNSVVSIGDYTFHDSKWYSDQPKGLVYAGKVAYALKGDVLEGKDVVLEDGTRGIGKTAFINHSIASLTIPSSVVYIPTIKRKSTGTALQWSSGLGDVGSIVIDAENPLYDSRDNCNAVIETASNTMILGSNSTTIPDGVTTVSCFVLGRMATVTVPSSVTTFDYFAFADGTTFVPEYPGNFHYESTSPVETIIMEGSTPPAADFTDAIQDAKIPNFFTPHFYGVNTETCTLYVPLGSMSDYMNADGWKDFQNIVEYDPNDGPTGIESVRESSTAPRQIFDLQGRRLNDASGHSIIIENGTKRLQR